MHLLHELLLTCYASQLELDKEDWAWPTEAVKRLTYNYGVDSYPLGDGFGHFGLAVNDVYKTAESIQSSGEREKRGLAVNDVYKTAESIQSSGNAAFHGGSGAGKTVRTQRVMEHTVLSATPPQLAAKSWRKESHLNRTQLSSPMPQTSCLLIKCTLGSLAPLPIPCACVCVVPLSPQLSAASGPRG
eukprot:1161464-Pelagomonas_calceolata.AAC.4